MMRFFFLTLFLFTLSLPVQAANLSDMIKKASHGDAEAQRQLMDEAARQTEAAGKQAEAMHVAEAHTEHTAFAWLAGTGMAIGFVFLLIGIEMPLRNAYWQKHAERTDGKVAGVEIHYNTHKGHTRRHFATVYRYTLSNGREYTGSDLVQSGGTAGRATGTTVPLLVLPDNPRVVRPATALVLGVGHIIFLMLGAGLFGAGVFFFPPTQLKWIVLGALGLIAVSRTLKYAKSRTHAFPANDVEPSATPGPEAQAILDKISKEGISPYSRQAQGMLAKYMPRRPFYPIEDILKADAEGRR